MRGIRGKLVLHTVSRGPSRREGGCRIHLLATCILTWPRRGGEVTGDTKCARFSFRGKKKKGSQPVHAVHSFQAPDSQFACKTIVLAKHLMRLNTVKHFLILSAKNSTFAQGLIFIIYLEILRQKEV